jgi:aspartyl-tRNA(Asn)/glutamyl-tRNA(Gln) amidotransferase subunit A
MSAAEHERTSFVISVHPHSPALSLWHQGPLTRTVSDEPKTPQKADGHGRPRYSDWYAGPELNIDYRNRLDDGVHGCRIAYSRTLGYGKADS